MHISDQNDQLAQGTDLLEAAGHGGRAALDGLPIPVFGLDRHGLVDTWNPAMARLTGRPCEAVLRTSLPALMETLPCTEVRSLAGGDHLRQPAELTLTDSLGRERRLRCLYQVELDAQGAMQRLVGVVVPDEEPEHLPSGSECSVSRAEIEETASAILHALNNIQTVLSGNLSQIRASQLVGLEPELRGSIRDARMAADQQPRLLRALRRVLHSTDISRGVCDVGTTIESFASSLDRTLPRGVDLTASSSGEHRIAVAPADLEDALMRLVGNAVEATGGEGRIELACRPSTTLADHVEVTVQDDGPGIHPAVLPRLTDPHFTTKEVVGRTGLGLTLVDLFVRGAGGCLSVESRSGAGTLVRLQLPSTPQAP